MSFLQVGRHVNPDRFSTAYDTNRLLLAATVLAPIALETTSDSSYFKFNLDYINLYNLVRLESSSIGNLAYLPAYTSLRNHTDGHQNAFFNMIDRTLTGANNNRDAQTVLYLNQWLQRSRRDFAVNLRGTISSCGDADTACNPIPIPQRVPTDFLWQRSPFQLSGGGAGLIESAGIDYLLPYWMARYYNIESAPPVSAANVVSAASGATSLAAESIASYYGANLAPGIAAATSLPLPTTLGGVSVQVQDSTGMTRLAPLFYVSPTQINFLIPTGTVPGQVRITLTNGGATATTTVSTSAPALFTANSTGKGVVAATAIRVTPNGQQSSVPVFTCTAAATCTAVPIVLGVDTPVYLTLYATGVRGRTSLANVSVTVRGIPLPVQYAGPQGSYIGLDQVNVLVPLTLRNTGEADLILTVDGQSSNPVRINIQ